MSSLKVYLFSLNLFNRREQTDENENEQRSNIIATRIYLVLIFGIVLIFPLGILSIPYTIIETIPNPSEIEFELLINPRCSCSHISVSYDEFVSVKPLFHKICSSDFISNEWIKSLNADIRSSRFTQFQSLRSFCQLSKLNVNQSLFNFKSTSLINYEVLSKSILEKQIRAIIDRLQQTESNTFKSQIQLIHSILLGNQNLFIKDKIYTNDNESWCLCGVPFICSGASDFYDEHNVTTMKIPGLRIGCLPSDVIVQSSLECFYNQTCVNTIIKYLNIETNFNAMIKPTLESHFQINSTIESIIYRFMVENWMINISYEKYYNRCAPISCTLIKNEQRRFLYVLNQLIALLGGVCAGLTLIVPFVVRFIRRRYVPTNINTMERNSIISRVRGLKTLLIRFIVELNLFKVNPTNDREIVQERIVTRIYLVLISFGIITLTFYSSLIMETSQETILNTKESEFFDLELMYPTSVTCPCSSISIPNKEFLTIEPFYHQMCSSYFISEEWFQWIHENSYTADNNLDFRRIAKFHFQMIASLCQSAEKTISDALQLFLQEEFISGKVISKELFELQINQLIQDWQRTTKENFVRTFQLIRFELLYQTLNSTQRINHLELYDSYGNKCMCWISPDCYSLTGIYFINITLLFNVPAFFIGCSKFESMLISTWQCFYSTECLDTINSTVLQSNLLTKPMKNYRILNSSLNQPNETIDSIINRLFIDEWKENVSFSSYYNKCSPSFCTFQYSHHRHLLIILIIFIGICGGLTTIIKILFFILLKLLIHINLNQSFSFHFNLIRNLFIREYLSKLFSIILLLISLIIIFLSSFFIKQNQIKQILNPSLQTYQHLLSKSFTDIQCPCSQLAIQYKDFINLSVIRQHQICSNDFIIKSLSLSNNSLDHFTNITIDYFLCKLTEQHLNDSINDLLNSEIVSFNYFNEQIKSNIKKFKLKRINSFLIIFKLICHFINDNTFNSKLFKLINITDQFQIESIIYDNSSYKFSHECIQSLIIDCYPLESLFKLTLQSLYNSTYFSQIQLLNQSFIPLNISIQSQYQINSTIETILNEIFLEEWSNTKSYENYYNKCAPTYCYYSNLEYPSGIEILTNLLGLYAGLTIIVKAFVSISMSYREHSIRQRNNRIHPQINQ